LAQPTLRTWVINENTTRYERLHAAPSDDDLVLAWSLWTGISVFITVFIALVLVSILLDRKARSNPFNQFLIYLMIPDLVFSGFGGVCSLLNVLAGHY